MAKFVLLYSGGSMPETEADQAAVLQAWGAWYGQLGSAVVDGGNPFTPAAKSIASDGSVGDGPVGTMATGYTIISADSHCGLPAPEYRDYLDPAFHADFDEYLAQQQAQRDEALTLNYDYIMG